MKVSEIGEFGLIDRLAGMVSEGEDKQAGPWRQLLIGIGDDAAAYKGDSSTQLVTTDCLIEGVHFTLSTAPWKAVGWKALAVNLSDIAAMGGQAKYALVSLAIPRDTEVDAVTDLYTGIIELARKYRVAIVGGNMSTAPVVMISITVIGSAPGQDGKPLTRHTAGPGDKIAVSGFLGTAAAGLETLNKNIQFDTGTRAILRKAFLYPEPRLIEGQLLLKQGVKTAIDLSDGLLSDLGHILKASQVSARVEVERIPIHPAVKANFYNRALELAISGGEDYELLFTGSAETIEKIQAQATWPVTVIGEIMAGKAGEIDLVKGDGAPFKPHKAGWEHFATR